MKTSDNVIIILLSIGLLANSLADIGTQARLGKLEKRGSVEVTLEKVPEVTPTPINTYNGPRLYNNKTKIVFHDSKEFRCLAENIYREARGEPYIGKISVAQVTYNRAEKVGSFCGAVYKKSQFSWTLNKNLKRPHGQEWVAAKDAARMFVHGVRVKNLEQTDHYHTAEVNPIWDNDMKRTAIIGAHQFFASK